MTTLDIETEANTGLIANADFNVGLVLRRAILPEFLDGVGNPGWRRRVMTVTPTLVAGDRGFDLPRDFHNMEAVLIPPFDCCGGCYPGLPFIGDDPMKMAAAALATQNGPPSGYYLANTMPTGDPPAKYFQRVMFAAPVDQSYPAAVIYYLQVPFSDNTTVVDLSGYIPEHFQYTLVYGLRRNIYIDRYGQGDQRAQVAESKFQEGIQTAQRGDMELARVHRPRFMT